MEEHPGACLFGAAFGPAFVYMPLLAAGPAGQLSLLLYGASVGAGAAMDVEEHPGLAAIQVLGAFLPFLLSPTDLVYADELSMGYDPTVETVQVYRVEGEPYARILVDENGNITVQGRKMLFLNFGQRGRAIEFLQKLLGRKLQGASIKSFRVPKSYLQRLRQNAVPESEASAYPDKPIEVDVTKAPDQYGLREDQLDELVSEIIQGSGEIEPVPIESSPK